MAAPGDTIRDGWESYLATVLPPDVHDIQRDETRTAFYAGAWFLLHLLYRLGEPGVSEEAGAAGIERLHRELVEFHRAVVRGEF